MRMWVYGGGFGCGVALGVETGKHLQGVYGNPSPAFDLVLIHHPCVLLFESILSVTPNPVRRTDVEPLQEQERGTCC